MTTNITRRPVTLPSGFTFHLVEVTRGSFMMGNDDENAYGDETIVHQVNVPSFWIAEYPVTQSFWISVIGDQNPSYFKGGQYPVEQVSWYDAAAFCNALNSCCNYPAKYYRDQKYSLALDIGFTRSIKAPQSIPIYVNTASYGFRLPSEAEWEYAARGGNKSKGLRFAGSNILDEVGWFEENSKGRVQSVGQKLSNELGVYDLSGNVYEWCEDQKHSDYENAPIDGTAWLDREHGASRILRGGSWSDISLNCSFTYRLSYRPAFHRKDIGFRVVLA